MATTAFKTTEYLAITGSQVYGTATPESDVDVAGVFLPHDRELFGLKAESEVINNKTVIQQYRFPVDLVFEGLVKSGGLLDGVVYSVKKFLRLLADNNPNILDIAFTPREFKVIETHLWKGLVSNHLDRFLTKKIRYTFCSYATHQLRRIESHRNWLLDPPKEPPSREACGLNPHRKDIPGDQLEAANAAIQKRIDSWNINFPEGTPHATLLELQEQMTQTLLDWRLYADEQQVAVAGRWLGYETNFMELIQKERKFASAQKSWKSYLQWKKERNPKRAVLEGQYGFDTKHGMHTIRLVQACEEVFVRGTYSPRRDNKDELVSIINGAWCFDRVKAYAAEAEARIIELYAKSALPAGPDWEWVGEICETLLRTRYRIPAPA